MSDESWFQRPEPPNSEGDAQYEAINAEVHELSYTLRQADEATVAAEQARLRPLAEQIADDRSRQRALARIDDLPDLMRGPQPGKSPEYSQAVILVAKAHGFKGPIHERIAEAERIKHMVGGLARTAPREEYMTILRMNSSIIRMIEDLQEGRL